MSINKNAFIRYQVIHKCLRNRYKRYYIEDILEEVNEALRNFNGFDSGIKKRQLFDDLKFLESEQGWSVPIVRSKDGKRVFYHYPSTGFNINSRNISEAEIETLNAAILVLLKYKDLPKFEWVSEFAFKMQSLFGGQADKGDTILFENNQYLKGIEFLPSIHQYIQNRSCIKVEYLPFKKNQPLNYDIHPYVLKQYNGRWFLFGVNQNDDLLYNLAIDRIVSVGLSNTEFKENDQIDFKDYFEDIVGVSRKLHENLIKVELEFSNEMAPYVLTKPIHGSQKKLLDDGRVLVVELNVIPNFELIQKLLSFGSSVRVISPRILVEKLRMITSKMAEQYAD